MSFGTTGRRKRTFEDPVAFYTLVLSTSLRGFGIFSPLQSLVRGLTGAQTLAELLGQGVTEERGRQGFPLFGVPFVRPRVLTPFANLLLI